jgi:CheY-like chemotaxis protein
MPEVDGLQATAMIRREEGRRGAMRTAILALTAHTARQQHEQCMASGMDGVITTPVSRATLLKAIGDAMEPKKAPRAGLFVPETT